MKKKNFILFALISLFFQSLFGFGALALKDKSIWIMRSDGALSCAEKKGLTLQEGAEELKNKSITVLDSKKATDGKLHVQMCGASTGTMNAYLIPQSQFKDAEKLGYFKMK